MTRENQIISIIFTFFFLTFFMCIKYIPADLILKIYIFATSVKVILTMILIIPVVMFYSLKEKDWGYASILMIFMIGQIAFVEIYADQYEVSSNPPIEKLKKIDSKFYPHWNIG